MTVGLLGTNTGLGRGTGLSAGDVGLFGGVGLAASDGGSGPPIPGPAGPYIAAMTVQPSAARKLLITNLINDLVTAGVWAKLDWFSLMASHDAQAARINAVTPTQIAVEVNAPTFIVDRGYTGNGTSSYLDTQWNPTTAVAPKHTQLDSHFGAWIGTDVASAGIDMGTTWTRLNSHVDATTISVRVTGASSVITPGGTPSSIGHTAASRTGTTTSQVYKSGAAYGGVQTTASAPPTNASFFICCANGSTTGTSAPANFSTRRMQAVHWGASLTAGEMNALFNALNTYMIAINAILLAETVDFLRELAVKPAPRRIELFNDMILSLLDTGLWAKLDWFSVCATMNEETALTNIRHPQRSASAFGSHGFTPDRGLTGDGSTGYFDTGWSPVTEAGLFQEKEAHFGLWCGTDVEDTNQSTFGNSAAWVNSHATPDEIETAINDGAVLVKTSDPPTSVGHTVIARYDGDAWRAFKNGSPTGDPQSNPSSPLVDESFFLLARNNAGAAEAFSTRRLQAYHWGGPLDDTDVTNLYGILETWMLAVGAA